MIDELRVLSQQWMRDGHGILLRKVVDLIQENEPRQLLDLMGEVERSMSHRAVGRFHQSTREWLSDGGHLPTLAAHDEFKHIESELERIRIETLRIQQSIQLSSLGSTPDTSMEESASSDGLLETIELSATDLTAAEVHVPRAAETSESRASALNETPAVVNQAPERLAMNQAPRVQPVQAGSPDSPESSLPTALVVGALIMCQALILFFCLFR